MGEDGEVVERERGKRKHTVAEGESWVRGERAILPLRARMCCVLIDGISSLDLIC